MTKDFYFTYENGEVTHELEENKRYKINLQNQIATEIPEQSSFDLGDLYNVNYLRKVKSGPASVKGLSSLPSRSLSSEERYYSEMLEGKKLLLAFAFASPQVYKKDSISNFERIDMLDHRREFSEIGKLSLNFVDETLSIVGTAVTYKKVWATSDNLSALCNLSPRILHFSGHGDLGRGNIEDYLVIENEFFEG